MKEKICKHVIGIKAGMGLHSFSPAARDVPIGEKKKRGAPKKNKVREALLRGPGSPAAASDTSDEESQTAIGPGPNYLASLLGGTITASQHFHQMFGR